MRVGIHAEGHDHIVFRAVLARLLGVAEDKIEVDRVDQPLGWQQVESMLGDTLRRFYATCCAFAVVAVDNDGNEDVTKIEGSQDPERPRHWLHDRFDDACRQCNLERIAEQTRRTLNWLPNKPGASWPILVGVPVETIESWLLVMRAVQNGTGQGLDAEVRPRQPQKRQFYGRPAASLDDVQNIAAPLVRSLTPEQFMRVRQHCRSFDNFASQVTALSRDAIDASCW